MILGFDLDGVLYPWTKAVTTYLQVNNGYTGTDKTVHTYIDLLSEMAQEFLVQIESLYSSFPPESKDMDSLNRLSKKYDILYITNRPESVRFATESYLKRYWYPNYGDLTMTKDKVAEVQLAGCDFFVEDRYHNASKLKNVTNVILYRQPYNYEFENEFEYCVRSLQDLERLLL